MTRSGFERDRVELRYADSRAVYSIFGKMIENCQLELCFPHEPELHSAECFADAMNKSNHLYAVYYECVLCGAVWLNRWEYRTARLNYSVFNTPCRLKFPMIMKEALEQLIHSTDEDGRYAYDCLISYVKEDNLRSCRATVLAGMKKSGVIPHYYGLNQNIIIYTKERIR